MKKLALPFLIAFLVNGLSALAQDELLPLCDTPSNGEAQFEYEFKMKGRQDTEGVAAMAITVPITVTVAFHIYDNVITSAQTNDMLAILNNAFSTYKIKFVKYCDDFMPAGTDYKKRDLPFAINVYIIPNLSNPYARSIGSNALYINRRFHNTSSLPHEMGHCLNLRHTHDLWFCYEFVNGTNCADCGDKICDTPADPQLYSKQYRVNETCGYIGTLKDPNGASYAPDTHNFMSYSRDNCRNRFTEEQGNKMYNSLKTLEVLKKVTKPAEIDGPPVICNSSIYTFNAPIGSTVTWSSTWNSAPYPTLVPNGNSVTINNTYKYPSTTVLKATVTGLCGGTLVITKTIMSETNSQVQWGSYTQEACYVNNQYQPPLSGQLPTTVQTPVFLHQECMATINMQYAVGKTVTMVTPLPGYWNWDPVSAKLLLQMPYLSGGIPYTFKITADGACNEKQLLFFSYRSSPGQLFVPAKNPVKEILTLNAKPNEELNTPAVSKESVPKNTEYTFSIYDVTTGELLIQHKGKPNSLKEEINVSKLPKGYYQMHITSGNDIQTVKFLKE